MFRPSSIHPDVELSSYLSDKIFIGEGASAKAVPVYSNWERPTNELETDFIVVYQNGSVSGVGMDTPYASGYVAINLYCKMNDDGSIKRNRIDSILSQFDLLVEKKLTTNYYFEYDADVFITPTTPNQSTGYSVTALNLRWTTTSNIINNQ